MIKISIILPVYNVEKYIDRAINSLISQKFSDYEIILCNDGSKDNSGKKCDEWAEKDHRIKVIHKENGGVASARNAALEIAQGEYIYFMDPDDYVVGELLSENYTLAKEHNADQVIFGFVSEVLDKDDNLIRNIPYYINIDGVYNNEEFKENYLNHMNNVSNVVWNRIYKRSHIGETVFNKNLNTAEDAIFNLELIRKKITNICYNNKIYYRYLCREKSLMNSYNPLRFKNEVLITDTVKAMVEEWGIEERYHKTLSYRYIETFLNEYNNMTMPDCDLKTEEIIALMKEHNSDERIVEAKKIITPKDVPYLSSRVTYILTNRNMYRSAVWFRRAFTPISKFIHKTMTKFGRNQH